MSYYDDGAVQHCCGVVPLIGGCPICKENQRISNRGKSVGEEVTVLDMLQEKRAVQSELQEKYEAVVHERAVLKTEVYWLKKALEKIRDSYALVDNQFGWLDAWRECKRIADKALKDADA